MRASAASLFGWKIAATSVVGQSHVGVDGPLPGRLLAGAGETVLIPLDLLHCASADEDTFELDILCPPRRYWIDGDDEYMRQ